MVTMKVVSCIAMSCALVASEKCEGCLAKDQILLQAQHPAVTQARSDADFRKPNATELLDVFGDEVIVAIGRGFTQPWCTDREDAEYLRCESNAGDRGIRVNTDHKTANDRFNIGVFKGKVCAKRLDRDHGWGMNLKIKCTKSDTAAQLEEAPPTPGLPEVPEGHIKIVIGASGGKTKCVRRDDAAVLDCASTAGDKGVRVNPDYMSAGDRFNIEVREGEVCATRLDRPHGWGMHLAVACPKKEAGQPPSEIQPPEDPEEPLPDGGEPPPTTPTPTTTVEESSSYYSSYSSYSSYYSDDADAFEEEVAGAEEGVEGADVEEGADADAEVADAEAAAAAEAARVAEEEAEAARVAQEAQEAAEAARVAQEAEAARVAQEEVEAARVAQEAQEAAEAARVAQEAAEAARVAQEAAEAARVAQEAAQVGESPAGSTSYYYGSYSYYR